MLPSKTALHEASDVGPAGHTGHPFHTEPSGPVPPPLAVLPTPPHRAKATAKMPRFELESLLPAAGLPPGADPPPPSSLVLPLVTRKR